MMTMKLSWADDVLDVSISGASRTWHEISVIFTGTSSDLFEGGLMLAGPRLPQ